jgi:hypothetical protein
MRGPRLLLLALPLAGAACASIAPTPPRFVVLFEQRTGICRTQIIRDTRSPLCVAAFKCGRDDAVFLLVDAAACVP